jgi:hypothetical protein
MMGKTRSQPLPKAEEALFKQVVKLYEAKQFKKAIKSADQVRVCAHVCSGRQTTCAQRAVACHVGSGARLPARPEHAGGSSASTYPAGSMALVRVSSDRGALANQSAEAVVLSCWAPHACS